MTSPLDAYLRHLVIERGLSKNTLSAYKADLAKYREYLDQNSFSELKHHSGLSFQISYSG